MTTPTGRSYLLDTNILIWLSTDLSRIPKHVLTILADFNSDLYVSTVSFWELAIKQAVGKMNVDLSFESIFDMHQMRELTITSRYTEKLRNLPLLHRDPWDRMLIAQAINEGLILVTSDRRLAQYPVATLQV